MRWTEHCLNYWSKSLVKNPENPSDCSHLQSTPAVSAELMFNNFINELDNRVECTLRYTPDGCTAVGKDLNRQENWAIDDSFHQRRWESSWLLLRRMLPASWQRLRSPLECCIHVWDLQHGEDMAMLKPIDRPWRQLKGFLEIEISNIQVTEKGCLASGGGCFINNLIHIYKDLMQSSKKGSARFYAVTGQETMGIN